MPDWFYCTVSRPILFRLPAKAGRNFTLGAMGLLSHLPLGESLIAFLGHMDPDPALRQCVDGLYFASPIGLGASLDGEGKAARAFKRFGVGFIEIGPVGATALKNRAVCRDDTRKAIGKDSRPVIDATQALRCIKDASPTPVLVWIEYQAEMIQTVLTLLPMAGGFTVSIPTNETEESQLQELIHLAKDSNRPVYLRASLDAQPDRVASLLRDTKCAGVFLDGSRANNDGVRFTGEDLHFSALEQIKSFQRILGEGKTIIANGGIHSPEQAANALNAGATALALDSGLVYEGPGLIKRTNEFLLSRLPTRRSPQTNAERTPEFLHLSWFWMLLMGVGLSIGGALALFIALTSVILPYDESFIGLTRLQLQVINPHVIGFLTHDRVTLAGTMVSCGMLYIVLAVKAVRQGSHPAWVAISLSALSGFAGFFLFLGFGYLDPLHAFAAAILFQLLGLALLSKLGNIQPETVWDIKNDKSRALGLWGQFLFILEGAALIVAGIAISGIGATFVFVPQDLAFLQSSPAELAHAITPKIISLIAHDRATMGAMLVANGWLYLLMPLWMFRAGARWQWVALALAGFIAYGAAIATHAHVGYLDLFHLAPAFAGLALHSFALAFSLPFLFRKRY